MHITRAGKSWTDTLHTLSDIQILLRISSNVSSELLSYTDLYFNFLNQIEFKQWNKYFHLNRPWHTYNTQITFTTLCHTSFFSKQISVAMATFLNQLHISVKIISRSYFSLNHSEMFKKCLVKRKYQSLKNALLPIGLKKRATS